ncbi:hypothetical protein M501DRAFT_935415 [Patellaria atrata CBS 101060]|uniref:Hemerythrin-like domain-containing protein n=1 Tax=Patellaria atrata CBS 101060 TaxID=1346257 RepID=A0A9P4SAC7_9PEZI|nr:hypothetical protein M501DRAFT_935415 [Patellaria atrata CBS 101060]
MADATNGKGPIECAATDAATNDVKKEEIPAADAVPKDAKEELPKLSAKDWRTYNAKAEHMDQFHNHFRHTWNMLYNACTNNKRPAGMSIRQFLAMGSQFCGQLTMHHDIEEMHIFPHLGRKMPAFRNKGIAKEQHKQIHAGLEKLEDYLNKCRSGERELRLDEMKGIMDGFGAVLWKHMDDEVVQLGAENMRKYWTLEELRQIPF